MKRKLLLILVFFVTLQQGFCWIYPEHRDIMIRAIFKLDFAHRQAFERFWAKARRGKETRLSMLPADTNIFRGTRILDYASFPAIAGDHSTCAADMVNTVLKSGWIFKVSDVAMDLKSGISNARNRSERLNKLRDSDLRLLKVDPEYVTRAGANNVHFMLGRQAVTTNMGEYLQACAKEGSELSAPGTFMWYHYSALQKAAAYAADSSSKQSLELLFSAFADESFGIHFLEDMFASGHVAGTRGNAAQRKGTHDYYNEIGLETISWEGKGMVLMGDAFMRPEDADLTAATVSKSLEQVIDILSGKYPGLINSVHNPIIGPDTFNVCRAIVMPRFIEDTLYSPFFKEIFLTTVRPGLAKGAGELPRARAELGPFTGLSAAAHGNLMFNGYSPTQNTAGMITGLEVNFRVGYGTEGILNEASDGAIFLEAGYRLDGSSTMNFTANPNLEQYRNITSAIPYRHGLHFRLRLPFYLIPGDLIVLAPLLSVVAPKAMTTVVATAGNGGLIPWQSGILSQIGRFQFVLGREVNVYFAGSKQYPVAYIVPAMIDGVESHAVVSFRSIQIEFPVVEYRPFHIFSYQQTASLLVQLFWGLDIPGKVTLINPVNIQFPSVRIIPFIGLRAAFDWKYFFSGK